MLTHPLRTGWGDRPGPRQAFGGSFSGSTTLPAAKPTAGPARRDGAEVGDTSGPEVHRLALSSPAASPSQMAVPINTSHTTPCLSAHFQKSRPARAPPSSLAPHHSQIPRTASLKALPRGSGSRVTRTWSPGAPAQGLCLCPWHAPRLHPFPTACLSPWPLSLLLLCSPKPLLGSPSLAASPGTLRGHSSWRASPATHTHTHTPSRQTLGRAVPSGLNGDT